MTTRSTYQNPLIGIIAMVGRFLLGAIFLLAGIMAGTKVLLDFNGAVGELAAKGLPFPRLMAVGAVVFLLSGSLSVILGFRARLGAALLFVFLVLTQLYFHNFWTIDDPEVRGNEITHFLKNLSLIGAMLFVVTNGAGRMSLDSKRSKKDSNEPPDPSSAPQSSGDG